MHRLSVSDIEMGQGLDLLIRLYSNSQSLLPSQDPDARGPFENFHLGFNSENPFTIYEDTSKSAPSGAGGRKPTLFIHEVTLPSS